MPKRNVSTTVGMDFIHLTYNLLYPAVLGSFVYEAAQHLTRPIPPIRVWWIVRGFLIALYCMDFIIARKLYTAYVERLHGLRLAVAVLTETLTVGSLLFAYWAESDRIRFFGCLGLFGLGIVVFNLVVDRESSKDRRALLVSWSSLLVGMGVCLAGMILPPSEPFFRIELGLFFALVATHYLLAVHYHPVLRSRIGVDGTLLDQDSAEVPAGSL